MHKNVTPQDEPNRIAELPEATEQELDQAAGGVSNNPLYAPSSASTNPLYTPLTSGGTNALF